MTLEEKTQLLCINFSRRFLFLYKNKMICTKKEARCWDTKIILLDLLGDVRMSCGICIPVLEKSKAASLNGFRNGLEEKSVLRIACVFK